MANMLRPFTVLGLETSCDETAASVVRGSAPGPGEILSNVVLSQLEEHRPYGGVVPEIAARAHVEALDAVIEQALDEAKCTLSDLDAIAATAGPGLIGGVMVGLTTGKALALAAGKPLIAVNHLEAHAFTARLTDGAAFPFLLLLISGGHCQLLAVEGVDRFRLYGTTIDDAIGEAFDKTAKLLGLPYPGGPAVEALAGQGDAKRFALPRPMLGREGSDFSLSGLKTAVRLIANTQGFCAQDRADLAAAFQSAAVDVLVDRTRGAMLRFVDAFGSTPTGERGGGARQTTSAEIGEREISQRMATDSDESNMTLVVAGGVAANRAIRKALEGLCAECGFILKIPPPKLCTDNAAMVAWAGVERGQIGLFDSLDFAPRARWPLQGVPARGSLAADTPEKSG